MIIILLRKRADRLFTALLGWLFSAVWHTLYMVSRLPHISFLLRMTSDIGQHRPYNRRALLEWIKHAGFLMVYVGGLLMLQRLVTVVEKGSFLPHQRDLLTIENFSADSLDNQFREDDDLVPDTFFFHHGVPAWEDFTLAGRVEKLRRNLQRIFGGPLLFPAADHHLLNKVNYHQAQAEQSAAALLEAQVLLRREENEGFSPTLRGGGANNNHNNSPRRAHQMMADESDTIPSIFSIVN